MPIAFKEWAVTVRALAEGEQLVTLRKGGIREANRNFSLEHERFFLYPTFDHQASDCVRESHRPELRRALEEGVWSDGEPPPSALIDDIGLAQPERWPRLPPAKRRCRYRPGAARARSHPRVGGGPRALHDL